MLYRIATSKIINKNSIVRKIIPLTDFLRKKRSLVVSKLASGTVLDVGCGPAEIINYFPKESKVRYIGIDTDEEQITVLIKNYPSLDFFWVNVDEQNLPSPVLTLTFDTVLLIAVIEHLKRPEVLLGQLSGIVKCSGKLIITTATPTGEFIHNILAIFGLTSFEAVREHKTSAHASYSVSDMARLVAPFGFKLEKQCSFEFGLNQVVVFTKVT
ncbi:MAG: class I SAM-dependent methyltransferase [Nitrososphaerota archaeon]|jgi:2-polyprenyl-3-methyl-5-hydroxy-6-metoxy-1,4-benzoquinol methylase|nr:class I SAM-dependent methyltransferase [Nitrososphaerota archaeon]